MTRAYFLFQLVYLTPMEKSVLSEKSGPLEGVLMSSLHAILTNL